MDYVNFGPSGHAILVECGHHKAICAKRGHPTRHCQARGHIYHLCSPLAVNLSFINLLTPEKGSES
jgi:hypothetical protein